jgi:hypothetical protein
MLSPYCHISGETFLGEHSDSPPEAGFAGRKLTNAKPPEVPNTSGGSRSLRTTQPLARRGPTGEPGVPP